MKTLLGMVVLVSIAAGGAALLTPFSQPPWSHGGRNHQCEIKCGSGYCLVDLTPQNKNDCKFACEPC